MSALCSSCREPLFQARLVINGNWLCSDCAYCREYGEAERIPASTKPTTGKRLHPQEERLFPLPESVARRRR